MTDVKSLFNVKEKDFVTENQLLEVFEKQGIAPNDPRLHLLWGQVNGQRAEAAVRKITSGNLQKITNENGFLAKVLRGETVVPDFKSFCQEIEEAYKAVRHIHDGNVASYIPQLARVQPDLFSVAICTVDGQIFQLGDTGAPFCLQSTSKPVNYAIALATLGEDKVHKHVGKEPSGRSFNELSLNHVGLPHNPLINAGAIMTTSLILPKEDISDRFDHIIQIWAELAGNSKPNFNNAMYLSERGTADRNFALAYFMRENKAFEPGADIHAALDSLPAYLSDSAIALFERTGVLTHRELEARFEIFSEEYIKVAELEAQLMIELSQTRILPAAFTYLERLASARQQLPEPAQATVEATINALLQPIDSVTQHIKIMSDGLETIEHLSDTHAKLQYAGNELKTALEATRAGVDALELQVDEALWRFPKYSTMLLSFA
jgi:hypothetical protein